MKTAYQAITTEEYLQRFERDFLDSRPAHPYDKYTKLNRSRQKRWLRSLTLDTETIEALTPESPQTWIVITEPWCGDAAHAYPVLAKLAEAIPNVTLKTVLRDDNEAFMDDYLTNGSKSIPKLVVRDETESDVFVWGPRPAPIQVIRNEHVNTLPYEELNIKLQTAYNADGGQTMLDELKELQKKSRYQTVRD